SDSLVALVAPVAPPEDAVAFGATGPGAASVDLQPGNSDAMPAPSEREPKFRRERRSERRRNATISSNESLSHRAASRRSFWCTQKDTMAQRCGLLCRWFPIYHVCEPISCNADGDCTCGACVNGHCYQGPGQCQAPPAAIP